MPRIPGFKKLRYEDPELRTAELSHCVPLWPGIPIVSQASLILATLPSASPVLGL